MIVIYEDVDLTLEGKACAFGSLGFQHVDPEIRTNYADTIYIQRDSVATMIKQRNGPLDPYPVRIQYVRETP